jgi:hypothetical protein
MRELSFWLSMERLICRDNAGNADHPAWIPQEPVNTQTGVRSTNWCQVPQSDINELFI